MPDPLPDGVTRADINRFIEERGGRTAITVPRGLSGVFDEHGNYRVNPLRHSRDRSIRARRAAAARRRAEFRQLIEEGHPAERIAELLSVSPGHVENVARELGLRLAGDGREARKVGPTTPFAVADNKKAGGNAAPEYPRARSGPASPRAPSTRRGTLEGRGQARRADREGRQDATAGDACRPDKPLERPNGGARESQGEARYGAVNRGTAALAPLAVPPPPTTPPDDSEIRATYRALHAAGMSNAGIALTMRVSLGHVRRMLWVLGLEPNPCLSLRRFRS